MQRKKLLTAIQFLLCEIHVPRSILLTPTKWVHWFSGQSQNCAESMKNKREESHCILNMTGKISEVNSIYSVHLAISFCPLTSTCKHLKTEDAFSAVGLIKASSVISCTCWGYILAILQASKINLYVNITHFDKVMLYGDICLHRHIELYFIKVCMLRILVYFLRNIWLNYILGMGNVWKMDCRITGDRCLQREVIFHSCRDFHLDLRAILVGVCAVRMHTFVSLLRDKVVQ